MTEGAPVEKNEVAEQEKPQEVPKGSRTQESLERSLQRALTDESLESEDKEKALRRILIDIEDRKAEMKKVISADGDKLAEARARLGLSGEVSEVVPTAFRHDSAQLDAMRDQVEKALIAFDGSVEKSERAVGIRKESGRVAEALADLMSEVNRRSNKGYDPFVDRSLYSFLNSCATELHEFSRAKGDVSPQEVAQLYAEVARGIGSMKSSARGTMKEDSASLRAMTRSFMDLTELIGRAAKYFREGDEDASRAANAARRAADSQSHAMSQKDAALRRYLNS